MNIKIIGTLSIEGLEELLEIAKYYGSADGLNEIKKYGGKTKVDDYGDYIDCEYTVTEDDIIFKIKNREPEPYENMWATTEEAAKITGLSIRRIQEKCKNGDYVTTKIGNSWLIEKDSLREE